jgi:uncharacterized protein involved in type VI secretion and phage assembly
VPTAAVAARSHAVNWAPKVKGIVLQQAVAEAMVRGEIETSLRLPAACTLWFADPDHALAATFAIGNPLVIDIVDADPQAPKPAGADAQLGLPFEGEIIAIEAVREAHTSYTVIRAYDKLHRLYRGRTTKAYLKVKYSDVAREVISAAGLAAGTIEDAPHAVVHDVVFQHHESGGELLERLAAQYGFIVRARGDKIDFCKPPEASSAPSPGKFGGAKADQLVLGDDLSSYVVSLCAESLVSSVEVRGWDPKKKEAVVGTASSLSSGLIVSPTSPTKANNDIRTGTKFTTTAGTIHEPGEADHTAAAIASHIAATYATIHATSIGNRILRGGKAVSIGPDGTPFAGKYMVTSCRQLLEYGQFTTELVCAGLDDRGLAGAIGGGAARPAVTAVAAPLPSVMIGIVTSSKDPEKLGRVKVKLPQLAEPLETDWMRVAVVGGGKDRGFVAIPEVQDEVLVAFENGDLRRGYVLGGLHNGIDKPTQRSFEGTVNDSGSIDKRSFTSRAKHQLVFGDKDGAEHVEIQSGDEKLDLKFDQAKGTITLDAGPGKSTVVINKDGTMTVECQGKISVESKTADIELKAVNIKMTATKGLEMKGMQTKIEGTGTLEAKSSGQAKLEGAQVSVSGQAMAELKGAIVKIN